MHALPPIVSRTARLAFIACLAGLAAPAPAHEPPADCLFLDDWDPLTPNGGLDPSACGLAGFADIGTFEADHGRIVLTPGQRDDLGLGPIAIAGTVSDAAQGISSRNYRVRFDFIGHQGIVIAAFFVRVHYRFDDATGAIDASTFSAIGIDFSFDSLGHDDQSNHIHDDVRGPCLVQLGYDGRHQDNYPGFLMTSETVWTMVMDIEEDAGGGASRVLVKLFPDGAEEPVQPFAAIVFDAGQLPPPSEELDHAFLAAAVGGGSLEILDLALCDIPDEERRVQNLQCQEQPDESVKLTWENPVGADTRAPIRVLVAGEERPALAGDATSLVLTDLPEGQVVVSVINFSAAAATCVVGDATPTAHYKRGDGNGDGDLDISDAVFLLDYLYTGGAAPGCLDAPDSNGDGSLDISDPVHLLDAMFLGGAPPAAPFPECGHGKVILGCEKEHCPHGA